MVQPMQQALNSTIAQELHLTEKQVHATVHLLEEGATIPFIARYRKEATGSLDEIAIAAIRDRLHHLRELDARRKAVLKSLEERELLTDELKEKIMAVDTLSVLEDIYLPFRPKRRTRAIIAKERGLEPLADLIMEQGVHDPFAEAANYVDQAKGVETVEAALQGARDIIAERITEDQNARALMRELFSTQGIIRTNVIDEKEEAAIKYKDYWDWEESVGKVPSHRLLAMRRGEKEGFLTLRILPGEDVALALLERRFVTTGTAASEQVKRALADGYKRLLSASMENEIRAASKYKADQEAIRVFAENLRQLLLAPPLGQKRILALDPGFRTGCKVVCLDSQGKLLHHEIGRASCRERV